jgi:hypothetical protein
MLRLIFRMSQVGKLLAENLRLPSSINGRRRKRYR